MPPKVGSGEPSGSSRATAKSWLVGRETNTPSVAYPVNTIFPSRWVATSTPAWKDTPNPGNPGNTGPPRPNVASRAPSAVNRTR